MIFLIYALVLACIPLAAVLLGLTVLRDQPGKLFALGYVVEGPLMLMLAVRFFAVRQASTRAGLFDPRDLHRAGDLLVGLAGLAHRAARGVGALAAAVWADADAAGQPVCRGLDRLLRPAAGLGGIEMVVGYTTAPGNLLQKSIRSLRRLVFRDLLWLPFTLLGTVLGVYTATLFVLAPIAVPVLSYQRLAAGTASAV